MSQRPRRPRRRLACVISFLLAVSVLAPVALGQAPEGFGQATTGGTGHPIVMVTTLEDYGLADPVIPGSLRQALGGSNRRIHFAVSGEIHLKTRLDLRSQTNVTVDGATAPPPGITLRYDQLEIRDSSNIIIRHIRSRDTADTSDNVPGFMIYKNCSNIWLDHLTVTRASDESIGVYGGAIGEGAPTNVTLSWNLIADADDLVNLNSGKAILISGPGSAPAGNPVTGEFADRVSVHHNLLTTNPQRNPQIAGSGTSLEPRVDFRNNIVHNWYHYAMRVRFGSSVNLVKNIFLSSRSQPYALVYESAGPVFASGNLAPPQGISAIDLNAMGTAQTPFTAPAITEHSLADLPAALVGDGVTTGVGALPRDAQDSLIVAGVAADLGVSAQSCAALNGEPCAAGQSCTGGGFVISSDFGGLCCVGGACSIPPPPDTDSDGVVDLADNCPLIANAGQENTDGDAEGGDACDITVTYPLATEASCAGPPPTITWTPEFYDRYRVYVGADPFFVAKVTSGDSMLRSTLWMVPDAKWRKICARAGASMFIKILGKTAGTKTMEYSETQAITVR